ETSAASPGQPSKSASWPVGDVVPQRFEPGPNERLIDPVAEFPTVFAREIRRTMQAEDSEGALRQAVEQIITGCRRDGTAQTVISRDGDWVPRQDAYRRANSGSA